ncbi:MAG: hypothetical protein COA78_17215 [Blastopirellula sp.]|nr:MAG: hypothetical protein COA78_17215 [Blastopirellula sp.]
MEMNQRVISIIEPIFRATIGLLNITPRPLINNSDKRPVFHTERNRWKAPQTFGAKSAKIKGWMPGIASINGP